MWPYFSKWVGWMLGHLLIAAYLQWELLVLDYGFSVKSDCPVFFASEVLLLMHSYFIL